jgi:hypothetical protein
LRESLRGDMVNRTYTGLNLGDNYLIKG